MNPAAVAFPYQLGKLDAPLPVHLLYELEQAAVIGPVARNDVGCAAEETLKILPASLKEAGLALGGNSARVMLRVQLPAAFGGIFTGVLLAISRVIGETAPLMFTALGCSFIRWSIDKPISAVPLLIWEFFNDPNLQELIWGASLFLLLFVLSLNLLSKYLAKKWNQ